MAALSASRLVWAAISLITWMMSLICSDDLRIVRIESMASWTAWLPTCANCVVRLA